ncbi:hypothetical protein GCM10009678_37130 [Actinomadura kijaniata]
MTIARSVLVTNASALPAELWSHVSSRPSAILARIPWTAASGVTGAVPSKLQVPAMPEIIPAAAGSVGGRG